MASNRSIFSKPAKWFSFSILATILTFPLDNAQSTSERPNQPEIVLFLQDFGPASPNATALPVAGVPGKSWSFSTFGTIFAVDDLITETPDKKSNRVGRAQGVLITSALDASNVHVLMSIVFTNLQYNGSSLELQGVSRQSERFREVSVVSGTGKFRLARGYAIFETMYYVRETSYSIIRCTIRLLES